MIVFGAPARSSQILAAPPSSSIGRTARRSAGRPARGALQLVCSVQTRRNGAFARIATRNTDARASYGCSKSAGARLSRRTRSGEEIRMALFEGSVTAGSPATQVPTTVPSASENVADVISGSPGSKDHPAIQRARTREEASLARGGTVTAGVPIFRPPPSPRLRRPGKVEATGEGVEG